MVDGGPRGRVGPFQVGVGGDSDRQRGEERYGERQSDASSHAVHVTRQIAPQHLSGGQVSYARWLGLAALAHDAACGRA
jgi:hypothetical protein